MALSLGVPDGALMRIKRHGGRNAARKVFPKRSARVGNNREWDFVDCWMMNCGSALSDTTVRPD
jgi:hypothetical protein